MNRLGAMIIGVCTGLLMASGASADSQGTASMRPEPALKARRAVESQVLGLCRGGSGLVAVGGHGDILASDGAHRWQQVSSPVDVALTRCSFADSKHGWAVGHNAAILHTDDGGQNWQLQNYQAKLGEPLLGVVAIDPQHAVAVGAFDLLMRTADGGKTWTTAASDTFGADGPHLNDIIRLAGGKLMVVGEMGLMAVSTDGAVWTKLKSPYDGSFFGAIPWGKTGALVFGISGNAYVANNLDDPQWLPLKNGPTTSLFGGLQMAEGGAVLVGLDGLVVRVRPDLSVARVSANHLRRVVADGPSKAGAILQAGTIGSFTTVVVDGDELVLGGADGLVTMDGAKTDNALGAVAPADKRATQGEGK